MRGGSREGAGRKQGFAAKGAEEARRVFADLIRSEIEPIAMALIQRAKNGEVAAAKELFDRAWGRTGVFNEASQDESVMVVVTQYSPDEAAITH